VLRKAERLFASKGYSASSLRELAKSNGVRMFTVHHHIGSKRHLYEEILRRWNDEVEQLIARVLAGATDPRTMVARVVEELFDFFLANRGRVALTARAALGEGLPSRLPSSDRGWVRFMGSTMRTHRLGTAGLDVDLLLITIEGILNNHTLSATHYRHLFGRDVTAPRVAARVKKHVTQVVLALLGADTAARN
jgi:AcrR family transcriptional regulator